MYEFIVYLVHSSICLVFIFLIYKVCMSHETLHRLNRCLLLGSVLLSAILPLCRITIVRTVEIMPSGYDANEGNIVIAERINPEVDNMALFQDLAVVIFLIGVAVMVARLAVGIFSVWRLIHSGRMRKVEKGITLTIVNTLPSPFSWFGHIVVSEDDMHSCKDEILLHEMAHVRLGHSWDLLFVDLALCLWWFNPALWLLRGELQSLHEYQADSQVLSRGIEAKTYQMLLIKRAVGSRFHSIANCLNQSNLKKRIIMMCKKPSSRWTAAKSLLVLPVVAVALGAFATTTYQPHEVHAKVTDNSVQLQADQKQTAEVMPQFNGNDVAAFCAWMQSQVQYPVAAVERKIAGQVLIEFVVDKDGSASSFKVLSSPDKLLSDEVERVFNTVRNNWDAAEHDGEKVSVRFVLPVNFALHK